MKIIVAGGTGFVGSGIVAHLAANDHSVVVLTRSPDRSHENVTLPRVALAGWDAKSVGAWASHVDGADAVINLVGESLAAKRWTERQKKRILDSRVDSTRAIVNAIEGATRKPKVLINGSAVGYYGDTQDAEVTENHPHGSDFLAMVVSRWEEEATRVNAFGVRIVLPRLGVVVGKGAEALRRLALPFKFFVGGPVGSGRQWFPWVHKRDVVSAISFFLAHEEMEGAVNVAAPEQVRMKEFSATVGDVLHRPSWLPVPTFALRIAVGEVTDMLVHGQKVVPKKLFESGYQFDFPELERALTDALL